MMPYTVLSFNCTSYMWIIVMVGWRHAVNVSVSSEHGVEKANRATSPSISTSLEGPHTQEIVAHWGPMMHQGRCFESGSQGWEQVPGERKASLDAPGDKPVTMDR